MLREMNDFIFKYRTVSGEWVSKGELPVDAVVCRGIWCLEVKHDGRLRARLVIDGSNQVADVEQHESFYAPTPLKRNIRIQYVYAQARDWQTDIFDIEKAFLLSEHTTAAQTRRNMWLQCPPGVYPEHTGKYTKVVGTLYGQRSAPSDWYRTLTAYVLAYGGMTRVDQDPCVFVQRNKRGKIIMLLNVHVDDGAVSGSRKNVDRFLTYLRIKYVIKVQNGANKRHLGINVDQVGDTIVLSGRDWLVEQSKTMIHSDTPMWKEPLPPKKLYPSAAVKSPYQKPYQEVVGKAIYAASHFAPMSLFASSRASMHNSQGSKEQLDLATRIIQFTIQYPMGIVIPRGPVTIWVLIAYSDSDLACHPKARSTMGGVILLNGVLIDWFSRIQLTVAFSTFEAEYVALAEVVREVLAVMHFLAYVDIHIPTAVVHCDQQKVVESVYSGQIVNSRQVRHLLIRFEHVVDHISAGRIQVLWIKSEANCADPFTKPVCAEELLKHASTMGLRVLPAGFHKP